jgi:isocitrate dehydrogenase kinase/phosphatase
MNDNSDHDPINKSQDSMLKLSNDISKMADRIGVMADRIGVMADRILETQKVESENVQLMFRSALEMMKIMNEQLNANNKILERLINEGINSQLSK